MTNDERIEAVRIAIINCWQESDNPAGAYINTEKFAIAALKAADQAPADVQCAEELAYYIWQECDKYAGTRHDFEMDIDKAKSAIKQRDAAIRAKDKATISDYEEVMADHKRLVRQLDVLLNGEDGAAQQASLCDIVAQVKRENYKAKIEKLCEVLECMSAHFDGYDQSPPWVEQLDAVVKQVLTETGDA